MSSYGIHADPFSETISAGRLDKAGRVFLDKQDVTDEALFSVAELARRHYGGRLEADFTKPGGRGFTVQVIVEEKEADDEA